MRAMRWLALALVTALPACGPAAQGPEKVMLTSAISDAGVTTVSADGRAATGKVEHLYTTTNKLFEVTTDGGTVLTTFEQPLALVTGGLRRAGDLKPGDRVWRWAGGKRAEAAVKSVTPAGKSATVYNLILGDSAVFVAGDFLARGKPPAEKKP